MTTVTQGRLLVVSAPSGTGKSTLCAELVRHLPGHALSISHTTRPPRGNERNGVDYYFCDRPVFERLAAEDFFLEWEQVYGRHHYGTSRAIVNLIRATGHNAVLDIDVKGAEHVKRLDPSAVLVLLIPPSMTELARRLRERKTDDPDEIARRLAVARAELDRADRFDYVIVNDELETAKARLFAVARGLPEADALRAPRAADKVRALLTETDAG